MERAVWYYKECKTGRRGKGRTAKLQIQVLATLLFEIHLPVTSSEMQMLSA